MAEFLRTQDVACLFWGTDQGTALVAKLPAREIRSVRGRVPIRLRHELYQHPAAPVIRTVLTIYDQPQHPLALETFVNVEEPDQRADFARLAEQERLILLFYDEHLAHRLTKVVPHRDAEGIRAILTNADALRARIPAAAYDFMRAKEEVLRTTEP
jgi:hypothetical protein